MYRRWFPVLGSDDELPRVDCSQQLLVLLEDSLSIRTGVDCLVRLFPKLFVQFGRLGVAMSVCGRILDMGEPLEVVHCVVSLCDGISIVVYHSEISTRIERRCN